MKPFFRCCTTAHFVQKLYLLNIKEPLKCLFLKVDPTIICLNDCFTHSTRSPPNPLISGLSCRRIYVRPNFYLLLIQFSKISLERYAVKVLHESLTEWTQKVPHTPHCTIAYKSRRRIINKIKSKFNSHVFNE